MKVIKYLDEHLEELLMVFFLGVISILIMLQVIMRYFFHHALPWPEEACRYLFVYSSMLSVSYCMAKDKNFVVEFIYDMFPKVLKDIIHVAGNLVMIGMCLYMSVGSISLLQTTTTVSSALEIPMTYIYVSLPICFTLAAVRGVENIVKQCLSKGGK